MTTDFVAVDLGASSGRVLLGRLEEGRFALEELHRFPNGPVEVLERLHWDVLRLWQEIKEGVRIAVSRGVVPAGIGVDTWGVDFALLDASGQLLGNPMHYRNPRFEGVPEQVFARVPRERIYALTGIQVMQINSLFQLYSIREEPQVAAAATLLMMPDLFHYWLTGRIASEITAASTSQLLEVTGRRWSGGLLSELGLPPGILPELIEPGTVLGPLHESVAREVGLETPVSVIAPGSHDTASAVAAISGLEHSAYISSGTWSLMGAELDAPVLSAAAQEHNFTNEAGVGGTIRFLKNIAGLWPLQESRRHWQRDGREYRWEDLLSAAEASPPFGGLIDPDAPDFLIPEDMPEAIRDFCRRSGQPVPEDLGAVVRCILESLALKYRFTLESLETVTGRGFDAIRVVGGGSRNGLLCQFTADACRRPVVAGPVEATALGNIMMQALASGRLESLEAGRRAIAESFEQTRYLPGSDSAAWDEAYARFQGLLD